LLELSLLGLSKSNSDKGGKIMNLHNQSTLSYGDYDINDYLKGSFACECGREHSAAIKHIEIKEAALSSLIPYLKANSFSKPFLIFDKTTYKLAHDLLINLFNEANHAFSCHIIDSPEPVPDEWAVGDILIHFDSSADCIIGVGSGTINDLSRFVSFRLGIPYIIVATAPSMDGYASNVAPLIVNHLKTTYETHTAHAIFADSSLLKSAPMNMLAAGIADILGKYSCLCDWEIAHKITGEYYCPSVAALVKRSLETVSAGIQAAAAKSDKAIRELMNALVLSGIAMSFAGNSRPASGSEHHLSHYWEMTYLFEGKKAVLHGTKVGIGTIAVIRAYELLMSRTIDFDKARAAASNFDINAWEADMKDAYRQAAPTVIALERHVGKNNPENVIKRIDRLEANWTEIIKTISHLPASDTIRSWLKTLGAADSPMSIGINKNLFIKSFIVAKELRNRYGLLQILFDLGLTEEIAEEVWEYFQQN